VTAARADLDEMRGGEERADYLRRLLHEPRRDTEAIHGEAMVIPWLPRDARTTAAVAPEKVLPGEPATELEDFLRDA
jgi:hypothetical protein